MLFSDDDGGGGGLFVSCLAFGLDHFGYCLLVYVQNNKIHIILHPLAHHQTVVCLWCLSLLHLPLLLPSYLSLQSASRWGVKLQVNVSLLIRWLVGVFVCQQHHRGILMDAVLANGNATDSHVGLKNSLPVDARRNSVIHCKLHDDL